MKEKSIQFESNTFRFTQSEGNWQLKLAKSQTRVTDSRQLALITESSDLFVPAQVSDEQNTFTFTFTVNPRAKKWDDVRNLGRNDQLRLLCNVARLHECLSTRLTFFLHPDNVVFDDNLMPKVVYRGIRDWVPPYEADEQEFLTQYKCLAVALFSKKYSFDQLYAGSLQHAKDTKFERQVGELDDFKSFVHFLQESYQKEQSLTEKTMQLVPKKRFRLFKQLAISMIVLVVVLAVPLVYFGFVKGPYQEKLLAAHRDFLATDYSKVISDLQGENPEKLSTPAKYILAYSYVQAERLSDDQKTAIMNNISLKSDPNYLLYWIYNGRGEFEESTDLAKYIDDPQLIMYGLLQQIDQAKNDPDLSGSEREELVQKLQDEFHNYEEKYRPDAEDDSSTPASSSEPSQPDSDQQDVEQSDNTSTESAEQENAASQRAETENVKTDEKEADRKETTNTKSKNDDKKSKKE